MMNQNKIFGRAVADGMLRFYDYKDKSGKVQVGCYYFTNKGQSKETDFFWRVSKADIDNWKISQDDLVDIVDQIKEKGSIESIMNALGFLPNQGLRHDGIVFRSRKNEKIAAHVVFTDLSSGSITTNPLIGVPTSNFNDFGQNCYMYFYYDIHHEGENNQGEEMTYMEKLMFGGLKEPGIMNM